MIKESTALPGVVSRATASSNGIVGLFPENRDRAASEARRAVSIFWEPFHDIIADAIALCHWHWSG
jgi:hypothetical protein